MIMETDVYNVEFDKQREAVFLKTFDSSKMNCRSFRT